MTDKEARKFINIIFEEYERLKKEGNLYIENDILPKSIISAYYKYISIVNYDDIIDRFKEKYIENESELEEAQKCEKAGLGEVYDYIRNFKEFDKLEDINNCLTVFRQLHKLLFSKCLHPEFGGQFRTTGARIADFAIDVSQISKMFYNLDKALNEIIKYMKEISETKKIPGADINIIKYINTCIKIKCDLIKTQPFGDGNKRTSRALMNLMFKKVGLPPVYVDYKEKDVYFSALEKAIVDNNYDEINTFYYYKICDSIYELDVKPHKEKKGIQKTKK